MTTTESGWPLVLSAEATIPSQTTNSPPQLALMNPTGEAFKIHEVRISVRDLAEVANGLTGAALGVKLDLGSIAITNGFVPAWSFGRVLSYDQDLNNQFMWRLAHPIHVPANGLMSVNFQNLGQRQTSIEARITYFCTSLGSAPFPRRIFLPWISTYTGKAFSYSAAGTDRSRETDLANPFNGDLLISRFTGRINVFDSDSGLNYSRMGESLLNARVSLSNGDPLVRTETPFQQIFGVEGRSWEQRNTILKPKQFFQVFVRKLAAEGLSASWTIQPFVSMVGYREMTVAGYEDVTSGGVNNP